MWRKAFAALFVIFGIVCVRSEDGKNQQTFVVRYKNGDQTIPVTVVLDYKKQTEYVINMSPRTSAKSVTLYDFKQRTIAYKDLTNRECFLGRLTHETLSEESDALNRVQNPVDHQPKILSLDPQRTALSPTEIRNMAGQKTAVFCRKMNTWLILPQESHSIRKRNVDDEDVDERTFHRHGYHTVRYSHYGHETRRRYRNSNRYAPRQLSHRNKGALEIPKAAYSEVEESVLPHHQPEIQPPTSNPDAHHVSESRRNQQHNHHHTHPHSHHQEDTRSDLHSPIPPNSYYEQNPIVPFHSNADLSHGRLSSDTNSHPLNSDVGLSDVNSNMLSSLFEHPTVAENSLFGNEVNSSISNPSIEPQNPISPKSYPEPSIYNTEIREHNIHLPEQSGSEPEFHSSGKNSRIPVRRGDSQIETESFSNELSPHVPEKKAYPKIDVEHGALENRDASTNAVEVPKITKKFENLESEQGHGIVAQTNEDLHDVFEGFYNMRGSNPNSDLNSLHNPHSTLLQTNHHREHSFTDESLIQSNPVLSLNTFRDINGSNWQRRGNVYSSPESPETSSIDSPVLTTTFYDYTRVSTDYPTDTVTTAPYIHSSRNKNPPHQFVQRYANQRQGVPLRSFAVSGDTVYDDNSVDSIPTTSFPTLPPLQVRSEFDNSNHRSDIPSESDQDEVIENISPTVIDSEQVNKNDQFGSSVVPTTIVKEGISLHHQRFHNILRQYKPDQIIIDIESIPTHPPPDSSLGFQQRTFPSTERPDKPLPHPIRTTNIIRNEQTLETRSNHTQSNWNHPSGRRNNHFPNGVNTYRRNNVLSQIPPRSDSNFYRHFPRVNNVHHQQHHPSFPSQFSHFNQPHMGSLPPGVSSIHPRHPNAPYADMFHPNVLQPVHHGNSYRTLKPHRQRHHRKKDRFQQRHSCCGLSEKDGKLSSCCRDGGECCSSVRRDDRRIPLKTPCCSGRNSQSRIPNAPSPHVNGIPNVLPSRFVKGGFRTLPLQHANRRSSSLPAPHHARTVEDKKKLCEKQKMCRTLYESTQQVMVCRNAEIEGC